MSEQTRNGAGLVLTRRLTSQQRLSSRPERLASSDRRTNYLSTPPVRVKHPPAHSRSERHGSLASTTSTPAYRRPLDVGGGSEWELGSPVTLVFYVDCEKEPSKTPDSLPEEPIRETQLTIHVQAEELLSRSQSSTAPQIYRSSSSGDLGGFLSGYVETVKKEGNLLPEEFLKCGLEIRDDGAASKTSGGWLGFIVKAAKGDSRPVRIGLPTLLDELVLTGRQWSYALVCRGGFIHICAVNIGLAFWLTMFALREHFDKFQGFFGNEGRVHMAFEFRHEKVIKWLCRKAHDIRELTTKSSAGEEDALYRSGSSAKSSPGKVADADASPATPPAENAVSRKFSLKLMRDGPTAGYIRQDITFSISPFKSFLSQYATGLKGSFISIRKFTTGYLKHQLAGSGASKQSKPGTVEVYDRLNLHSTVPELQKRLRLTMANQETWDGSVPLPIKLTVSEEPTVIGHRSSQSFVVDVYLRTQPFSVMRSSCVCQSREVFKKAILSSQSDF